MIKPEVVAIIPAAGHARRLAPLPCSKEIFPIGFQQASYPGQWRPKVVTHYLLEHLREAGIAEAIMVIRRDKTDIVRYLGDGHAFGINLEYRMIDDSSSSPMSIDAAFDRVEQRTVALGFPDILFNPCRAYDQVLTRLSTSRADVVLGLFPVQHPSMVDMVAFDAHGEVTAFEIKPKKTALKYQWTLAVWTPRFSAFMHDYLGAGHCSPQRHIEILAFAQKSELYMSDVLYAAQRAGLKIYSVVVSNELCLDMGTPQTLCEAIRLYSAREL